MKSKLLISMGIMSLGLYSTAQQKGDPKETEVWSPEPKIVSTGAIFSDPPSDAIILFNGKNLDQWSLADDTTKAAGWTVNNDGSVTVKKGTGTIQTKRNFMDYQLHIEYRIPENISGTNQARGNSGIFLASAGKGDDGYNCRYLIITITKRM